VDPEELDIRCASRCCPVDASTVVLGIETSCDETARRS
jgi:hypothetical protein